MLNRVIDIAFYFRHVQRYGDSSDLFFLLVLFVYDTKSLFVGKMK